MKFINLNNKTYNTIIIDTSSLLKPQFEKFMRRIIPVASSTGFKVTIPHAVIRETKKISAEMSARGLAARRALENIAVLEAHGYLRTEGNPKSNESADAYILSRIIKQKKDEKILVITQDYGLAKDILNTNKNFSLFGHMVHVFRAKYNGELEKFDLSQPIRTDKQYNNLSTVLQRFGL